MNVAPAGQPAGVAIGVDLGGTGTRFVALDASCNLVSHSAVPTPTGITSAEAVEFLQNRIEAVAGGAHIRSIGIGASGPIDGVGVIRNPDTLPAFTGINLAGGLGAAFAAPVAIDNDAVTAAICEATLGAARDFPSLLMITLGTGVGVSALIHGEPVRGADGVHPEAGHLSVSGRDAPCYCGRSGCWEQIASRSALQRAASLLLTKPSGGPLDIQAAAERALAGDEPATSMFDDYGRGVAAGLCDLLTVHRPACVVLGGSGANSIDAYQRALHEKMRELNTYAPLPPVLISHAGDLGGANGAAILGARRPDRSTWLTTARR